MTAKKRVNKADSARETVVRDWAAQQSPRVRALIESCEPNILRLRTYMSENDSPFDETQRRREEILKACWPGEGLPPEEIRRFRRIRKDNSSEIVFGWRFKPEGEFFEDPYLSDRYGKFDLREGEYIEDQAEGQTIWQVLHQRLEAAILRSLLGVIPADGARTFVRLAEEISNMQTKITENLDQLERNINDYHYLINRYVMAKNLLNSPREEHTIEGHIVEIRPARPSAVDAAMEDKAAGSVAEVAKTLEKHFPTYSMAESERDLATCKELMSQLRSLADQPTNRAAWLALVSGLRSLEEGPKRRDREQKRGGGRLPSNQLRLLIAEVAGIFDDNCGWWLGLEQGRRLWKGSRDWMRQDPLVSLRNRFIETVLQDFPVEVIATTESTIKQYAPSLPAVIKGDLKHVRNTR